jgi:hypothetical protein
VLTDGNTTGTASTTSQRSSSLYLGALIDRLNASRWSSTTGGWSMVLPPFTSIEYWTVPESSPRATARPRRV